MSKLEELIQELCPNGVKYDYLCNVCSVTKGVQLNKDKLKDDGLYPVINGGINPSGYWDEYNFDANLITISQGGASAGYVNYLETPFWAGAHCYVVKSVSEDMNYKYVYYLFKENEKKFMECQYGAGIPSLSMKTINETKVPVPPMEVQSEIVRILDNFTLLTAELTAELTARKEQYNYYRSQLLNFDETIKKISLSDIAKFTYGYTDKALDIGDTRYIRITDIDDEGCLVLKNEKYINGNSESSKYLLKYGDLLVARTGATFGKTLYYGSNDPAVYASFLIKIELDNSIILNRYYWHYSKSKEYWEQANKLVSIGGQQQFNANAISRLVVPVPSIAVQERIINVLDNFDSICTDLEIGLPAEIEARKQQYEFYRTKLLTMLSEGVNLSKQAR